MPSPARRNAAAFFLFLSLSCAATPMQAQTLTWNPTGGTGSGTWDTTTANWFNGTTNVPWTNGANASFRDPAGTVSINGSVTASQVELGSPGYVIQNFFLNGTAAGLTIQTNADATISSSIFGANPNNTIFTKTGSGVLSIAGSGTNTVANGPVFFGSAVIAAGEMRFTGTVANFLSTPAVLADSASVLLTFAAPSNVLDSLAGGANGGVVRPNVTSGALTLTLNGSDSTSFAGTITDNGSATMALSKVGTATQTLTGANTYTGATSVVGGRLTLAGANGALPNTKSLTVGQGATLLLDDSAAINTTRVGGYLPVALIGGTLALNGNATAMSKEQVGAVTFSGASSLTTTSNGPVAQLQVTGGLTRSGNGTLNFSDGGGVVVSGLANTNGIVAPWATVNGTDWAAVIANNAVGAYTGYSTSLATATTQENLRITSAGTTTTLPQSLTRNTLRLVNTGSAAATLDLGANQSLTLTAGGLLTSGTAGQIIQNGKLLSTGNEIIVINQNALTISSPTANSSAATTVTKSGTGTLVLSGPNTYSGPTVVNQGTLQVSADANLGTGSAVALNGGTLQAGASFTSTKSLQGSGGGAFDTAGNKVTFTGGNNTGSFSKVGSGTLALSGSVASVTINAGVLNLSNLASGNAASLTVNAGRLEASGTGVQTVNMNGLSAELSPGAVGQASMLTLATLTVNGLQATVDFDLGSTAADSLSVTSGLTLSGTPLLFRFSDLGGTRTGVAYPLLTSPSLGRYTPSNFGFDPASTAAGYQGTFNVSNNTLSVTFSAVPEPGTTLWLLAAALVGGGVRRAALRKRR